MSLFKSTREKQLWFYVLLVLVAIIATLFFGRPVIDFLDDQNIQAAIFLLGMTLIGIVILIYGLKTQPSKKEIVIWIGLIAVYIMFFLRLGLSERSHMIEYSVLAIFIHRALIERLSLNKISLKPALVALVASTLVGVVDECIQIFSPNRVFDPIDIFFNGFVSFMAIGSSMALQWIRTRNNKK